MSNIIKASFTRGSTSVETLPLWQYDYGQLLQITGLELPSSYEVHFSNTQDGTATTAIGDEDGVAIPDAYLTHGDVYAWLYLHTGANDGETVYQIHIPVRARAAISNATPTPVQQDAITQAIAALNAGVTEVEGLAEGIPQTIDTALAEAKASGEFDGEKGDPGDDGFSPTVTVADITGGHRVTVTDASGDHVFDVLDGEVTAAELAEKADKIHDTVTDQSVASVPDACVGAVNDLVLQLEPIQAGSGDPSPSNVRAISGHESAKVFRTGKNVMCGVLSHPVAVYAQGDPDTECIITSSAGTSLVAICKAGVTYTVSGIADRNRGKVAFFESYPDVNSIGENITISNTSPDGYRFTATKDGYYACYMMNSVVSTASAQIEIGTTATEHEQYTGSKTTAQLPVTVYGGEVDWKRGKVKVTKAIATWVGADSENYTMDTDTTYGWRRFRKATTDGDQTSGRKSVLCNMGVFSSTANTVGTCFLNLGYIYYYAPDDITSVDAFKEWLQTNNLQFVYPLATPVEYDLSSIPEDITLVFGENNIWIDNGKVKSMTYPCDTKKYIDKKVAELQALILDN